MAETALITGASSGIGEALARRFAGAGFDLVLVARSADKLKALAEELTSEYGIKAKAHPADLTQPGAAEKLAAAMKRGKRRIDILVNNAGILEHGEFVGMRASRHRELIELNVTSLSEMLAHFLPAMVERGSGKVLNVASIAAFQPIPMLATYAATKAYVLSLTESLSEELQGTGVTITALCPGITATSMLDKAQEGSSGLEQLPGFVIGTAEAVAGEGFDACMAGEVIRVPGKLNLAATLAGRGTPRWIVRRVTGALARRLKP